MQKTFFDKGFKYTTWIAAVIFAVWMWKIGWPFLEDMTLREAIIYGFVIFYGILTLQAGTFLYWTLLAWNDPEKLNQKLRNKTEYMPRVSFTALLPALHEKDVIGQTIEAIDRINYPDNLKELLVLLRREDTETIEAAQKAIATLGKDNIRIVLISGLPINKPSQLNWGLIQAKNDVVVIFDAEDQPHREIYRLANNVFSEKGVAAMQAGVQLVNFKSKWFSVFNCLEYFFWFKSVLPWFAKQGVVPLGGNTVFFKRETLLSVGGWDEKCLTEDGEIGLRLSKIGAKIEVVYEEEFATQEETPPNFRSLIKQRTRWNQGFLQIFMKSDWKSLPKFKQKILAAYVLLLPVLMAGLVIVTPILVLIGSTYRLPLLLSMWSYIPLVMMGMFVVVLIVGSMEFARGYKFRYPLWMPILIMVGFIPYQAAMTVAAGRAVVRLVKGNLAWEKTAHINAHRSVGGTV